MSSTQQGSSVRGRRNKDTIGEKQSRRSWSPREEAVLLASLKEMVANGWKSDNGFRAGYLQRLEEAMLKEFPGANIHAFPHINSKMQIWKKNYYSFTLMLRRSGIGFNVDGKHTIPCEDEQWEQIKKCDLNAKNMRLKSWPMFEEWQEIFGKDRATGKNAEDLVDVVNDMKEQSNGEENKNKDGKEDKGAAANEEDMSFGDVGENSVSYSEKGEASVKSSQGKGKRKKRSVEPSVAEMVEVFCEISRGTNSRLEMVAQRIGHEYDMDQAKRDGFNQLENIPNLTLKERFDVAYIFAHDYAQLLVFQGLPQNARTTYVDRLLGKEA